MGMQDIRHAQGEGCEFLLHLKSSLRNGQLAFLSIAAADGRWISFVLTPIEGAAAKWLLKTPFYCSSNDIDAILLQSIQYILSNLNWYC